MRDNIAALASNIFLGFRLGRIPPVTAFLGLSLEVRHVTLLAEQRAAAAAALGLEVSRMPALWCCVAAISLIGMLNLAVSFDCACRLALQALSVSGADRAHPGHALPAPAAPALFQPRLKPPGAAAFAARRRTRRRPTSSAPTGF